MRIAFLADIHGNGVALEAALRDIERQRVDQTICLGDVAMGGPQPRECLSLIQALNCPVIMGNTDEWLIGEEAAAEPPASLTPLESIAYWNARAITGDDLQFMRGFLPNLAIALGEGHTLLCFHGSPDNCRDTILATTPESALSDLLGTHSATVLAGAHMHLQILRRHLGATFINPGSVGMPLDREPAPDRPRRYTPRAEYAILDWDAGQANVTFRRVPYAQSDLLESVQQSGMPAADWYIGHWTAD
jgi:predicted phosphodiesterase